MINIAHGIIFRLERKGFGSEAIRSWQAEWEKLPAGAIVEAIVPGGPILSQPEEWDEEEEEYEILPNWLLSDKGSSFETLGLFRYMEWVEKQMESGDDVAEDFIRAVPTPHAELPTLDGPLPQAITHSGGWFVHMWERDCPARTSPRRAVARWRAEMESEIP